MSLLFSKKNNQMPLAELLVFSLCIYSNIIYFCCMDEETHPPDEFMRCFGNQPHDFHLVGATMNIKPLNNGGRSSPPDV